ncbi:methyltransferase [Sphingomonas sp. GCM10030256]|uniref:methyltransferase n=1 Tax=Sphingomonas sp. GCM10030256 TaxID=3273427 RepID=UPI00361D38C1
MAGEDNATALLAELLKLLDEDGYSFTAITPATHARVLERRRGELAGDLRDVLGWSMEFERGLLSGPILTLLEESDSIEQGDTGLRSKLRVAELGGRLFLHSAYPTSGDQAVFFGPDTYRFVRFLEQQLADEPVDCLVDYGAGSGAGGIAAASLVEPARTVLLDSNAQALRLAEANALAAGASVELVHGDTLAAVEGAIDLIIANPPFIADPAGREYRDGGGIGIDVSLQWARDSVGRLAEGGRMLLYTGSPIIAGEDQLLGGLAELVDTADCTLSYQELDPDIFGEELEQPAYAHAGVERIAAVGAVIRKP